MATAERGRTEPELRTDFLGAIVCDFLSKRQYTLNCGNTYAAVRRGAQAQELRGEHVGVVRLQLPFAALGLFPGRKRGRTVLDVLQVLQDVGSLGRVVPMPRPKRLREE